MKVKDFLSRVRATLPKLKNFLPHATITVGSSAIVVGVGQIYGPAGWITAGVFLVLAGLPIF